MILLEARSMHAVKFIILIYRINIRTSQFNEADCVLKSGGVWRPIGSLHLSDRNVCTHGRRKTNEETKRKKP